MDKILQRFFKKIKFDEVDSSLYNEFIDASFLNVISEKESALVRATIKLNHYLSYDCYAALFKCIKDFVSVGEFAIQISFSYEDDSDDKNYLSNLIIKFNEENNTSLIDSNFKVFEEEKKIIFFYLDASLTSEINDSASMLASFLKMISCKYKVMTQEMVNYNNHLSFQNDRDRLYQEETEKQSEYFKKQEEINSSYQPCKLKDISNFKMVIVEGKIFTVEDRVTKKEKLIRKIGISDFTDSIYTNLFEKKDFTVDDISIFSEGKKVRVLGRPFIDEFTSQLMLKIDNIEIIEEENFRVDTEEKKRVELHLHTKMSPFDGVSDIEEYVKMAKRFNMTSIAITDHDGVQGFPSAQKAAKANQIKMIYGCEFSYINDNKFLTNAIFNPSDKVISKSNFVVFDTETTGLSNRYDDLIEFGAVKYSSSFEKLDEIDFFIKTDKKLSKFTLETSNITKDDVDNGKDIVDALNIIKEFFEDCILVAHNAKFDYDFINEKLKEHNMKTIKNPVIDTLPLARYLYPENKSFREEAIAKSLGLSFSSSDAHRANYDAMHLAEIYSLMLPKLLKNNMDMKHKDIAFLTYQDQTIMSLHPYHLTVLAKNQDGIKDLYELVSNASIKHINKQGTPILLKSVLEENRKNLLIGSSCLNGEVFETACNKSIDELKEVMKLYDYIEVQPPSCYSYLINTGKIDDENELHSILKDIIFTAKEIGKIVVATGDCHYVNKEEKIFRDVIIATKGLRGIRHPLCLIPKENESRQVKEEYYKHPTENPDQNFLSTDEMKKAFSFLNDDELIQEIVVTNTNHIASMFDEVKACKDGTYPPSLPGSDEKLRNLVYSTAESMYGSPLPSLIQERLETELSGIIGGGYSVHYWLSSLIIKWCNEQGYIVGSRGSVGSSLVATMSSITEVNPLPPHYYCPKCHHIEWADVLAYESGIDLPEKKCPNCNEELIRDGQNIPFATFLGFKAEKVPDIDLNFPSNFQAQAHLYMRELLNATGNTCYKAGTIQTIKDKKAYSYALGYFESRGVLTSKVRPAHVDFLAHNLYGIKSSTGQHPGGIIVIPNGMKVTDFTPVQYPAGKIDSDWETTHFDFHAIHDNVLKFDMLAHQDPVAIKMMCDLVGIKITEMNEKIPLSDSEALSIFWSSDALKLKENVLNETTGALGLPEFGTVIGRRTLIETKAHSFADLVRISGLSHGTDVYAGNARELILNDGKSLRDVIACRDDIMVRLHEDYGIEYTDSFQIMELVRKGNFCKSAFKEKREKYTQLMKEHNVPDFYIASCEKIKYLFPRGHAVAYVSMAVRVAYFKVHYPLEYYSTYFTVRANAYDVESMMKGMDYCVKKLDEINEKIKMHKASAKEEDLVDCFEQSIEMFDRGFSFSKMHINTCHSSDFLIDKDNKSLLPSLKVIDGLGEMICDKIYSTRIEKGNFTSVDDLKNRAGLGNSIIDKLRPLGLLDDLPEDDQITLF